MKIQLKIKQREISGSPNPSQIRLRLSCLPADRQTLQELDGARNKNKTHFIK